MGYTHGRPKGSLNICTREGREAARQIIESDEYRKQLKERAKMGTLPPAVECMLWYYRYGKPVENSRFVIDERINVDGLESDAGLLLARAEAVAKRIRDAEHALELARDVTDELVDRDAFKSEPVTKTIN